jgi:hypothetical protein
LHQDSIDAFFLYIYVFLNIDVSAIVAPERIAIENAQFALQGFACKSLLQVYRKANSFR